MKWKPNLVLNNIHDLQNELKLKTYTIRKNKNSIKYDFGAADPFIYNNYLFCELIDKSLGHKGGVIGCSPLKDNLNFKIIIKENFHLSYPHIFEHKKNIYMIPESSDSNKLFLYQCIDFPYKWIKKSILKDNFPCSDSTIFTFNNKLYLFTTKFIKKKENECETYLFKIKDLLNSKLKLIKKNILPLKYRGGGNTFILNNELYIPIQPSEVEFYGQRLSIYKIKKLENKEIVFEFAYEIKIPSQFKGIHHLSNHNNIFICDNL